VEEKEEWRWFGMDRREADVGISETVAEKDAA
jgi:hypothetical protein